MNAKRLGEVMQIRGQTRIEEIRFLAALAQAAPHDGAIVDLGTYHGRSAAALCEAVGGRGRRIVTIDDYSCAEATGPRPTREEVWQTMALWGYEPRILDADSRIVPAGIDRVALLLVDTKHVRVQFDAEMTAWLPLVVKGGIVACHDYGSPTWTEMTGAITAWLGGWERIGLVHRLIAFRKGAA